MIDKRENQEDRRGARDIGKPRREERESRREDRNMRDTRRGRGEREK